MNRKWTDQFTKDELWSVTKQKAIEIQIKRRKLFYFGHKLRKEAGGIEKTTLEWNPQGCRKRGRPKRTLRRTIEGEMRSTVRWLKEVKSIAADRKPLKHFMNALCCARSKMFR